MSDCKSNESLNEEGTLELLSARNKHVVTIIIEQLLVFLVYRHSGYLETSSFPDENDKETSKLLRNIAVEAEGKIFHNESHDVEDETKWLEEIIEAAISRCKDELQVEDCNPNLSVKDNDSKFYRKLLSLLNGVPEDMSALANDSAGTPNVFELSTSSVEKGESERELVRIVKQREEKYHEALTKYEKERIKLREKIETLRKSLTETEEILNDVSTEYCELKEEIERIKKEAFFKEVPQLSRNTSSTPDRTDRQVIAEESSSRAELSLVTVPTDTVEREVHNNYKLLLLRASQMLLRDEKEKLRSWAASGYSVEISGDVFQILAELDKKGIISSSNLTVLKTFFEEIMRIDLVFIIENFLAGEYSLLRNVQSLTKESNRNRGDMAPRRNEGRPFGIPPPVTSEISNPIISVEEIAVDLKGASARQNVPQERYAPARGQLIAESDLYSTAGSNGNKLSRPYRAPETQQQRRPDRQAVNTCTGPWLCSHYKRRCLVKFDCCEKYWPCHRCHNSQNDCGRNKLKSRDIVLIKCTFCQKEQRFNESSQYCSECGIKFAEYFCARCKHLTGTDDNPYHCEKCGICRIHGDRSFHCDVCGVCLDIQLKNNHKCREDSAHDECCICLEDAFTGCQILPCSHKVHKECATQMIRSGITQCPICRESFAHKIERRPIAKHRRR